MDGLTDEIRQEPPWTVMFVDDIVICREQVEENLENPPGDKNWRKGE